MKNTEKKMIKFLDDALERLTNGANKQAIKSEIKEWIANEKKLSNEKAKIITFRNTNLSELNKIVNIDLSYHEIKFDKWFNYEYKLSNDENNFLDNLLKINRLYLTLYNETTLTVKFIGAILNKVNFINKYIKDWYEYKMSCKLNGYTLSGEPDFIVATGIETPETPYFFLQEYKRAINPTGNPEHQVIAAMLTAITLNNTNTMKGGYIIGRLWTFVILDKLENGNYEYFVSKGFDCLDFDNLKQIYINLQAVKFLYCK